jgi:hypothetical protein
MAHKTPVMEEVFLSHVYLKVNLTARRLYIPKKNDLALSPARL